MINRIILVLICFTNTIIFSQKNYEPASITYRNGTIKNGFIKFSSSIDPFLIILKESEQSTPKEVTADQVSNYTLQNLERKVSSENIDGKLQFLEVVIEGKASLLMLMEQRGNKRYFLKSTKTGVKELIEEQQITGNKKFKLKKYIGLLNLEFNDCDNFSSKINSTQLQLRSLAKIFKEYNQCVNELTYSTERIQRKGVHKIGIETGFNFVQMETIELPFQGDFNNKNILDFGLLYRYTPTIFSSRFSVETSASFFNLKTQRELSNIGVNRPNRINLSAISHTLGFSYDLTSQNSKIKPFLHAFYLGTMALNKEKIYKKVRDNNESNVFADKDIKKYEFGYGAEIGVKYSFIQNQETIFKIGYRRIGNHVNRSDIGYLAKGFNIRLGYLIKL